MLDPFFVEQETNGYGSSARRTCNGRERGRGQGYDEPVNRLSSEESERFRPMTERGDAGPDEVGERSFDDFVFEKRLRAGFGGESSAGDREPPVRAVAAQKVVMCIERVRATLGPLRSTFVRARHELGDLLDQLLALLEECSAKVTPHLPQAQDDSSDDDYF